MKRIISTLATLLLFLSFSGCFLEEMDEAYDGSAETTKSSTAESRDHTLAYGTVSGMNSSGERISISAKDVSIVLLVNGKKPKWAIKITYSSNITKFTVFVSSTAHIDAAAGEYALRASAPGYETTTVSLGNGLPSGLTVNFVLRSTNQINPDDFIPIKWL